MIHRSLLRILGLLRRLFRRHEQPKTLDDDVLSKGEASKVDPELLRHVQAAARASSGRNRRAVEREQKARALRRTPGTFVEYERTGKVYQVINRGGTLRKAGRINQRTGARPVYPPGSNVVRVK